MNTPEQKSNSYDQAKGMPKVANLESYHIPIVVVGLIISMIVLACVFKLAGSKEIPQKIEDDVYRLSEQSVMEKPLEVADSTSHHDNEMKQPDISPEEVQQRMILLQEKQKEIEQRLAAPLMIVNNTHATPLVSSSQAAANISDDANTQFMRQVANQSVEVSTATPIGPLNAVIAEGSLIHAILETATNSDLPGYLRAIVKQPVYSEDGSQVLIPSGSRLIGQYKSGMLQGQSRIFVVWTRLITTEGYSLNLGSPGVDSLGMAGMGADSVDRHFWARFGQASLLSLIGAGASSIGDRDDAHSSPGSLYREALASSFSQSSNQALQTDLQIAPTLQTFQGKPVMVFVAKDLHFQAATQHQDHVKQIF